MAESVDARDLKSLIRKGVRVQFPLSAPKNFKAEVFFASSFLPYYIEEPAKLLK